MSLRGFAQTKNETNYLEIHSSVHCSSFGTHWVPISQIFESKWVFKDSPKIGISPCSIENVAENENAESALRSNMLLWS